MHDDSRFYTLISEGNIPDEPVSSTSFNDVGDEVSLWSELPSLALEKVYSFLCRKDQIQMALVCRRWLEEYSAPSIWRNIKFDLLGYDCSSVHPEIQWTQNYGHMFRHVEISCSGVQLPLQEEIYQQLKQFLQSLICHSHLLSTLSFINMDIYFQFLDEIIFEDIYQSILNLLLVQNKLTSIKFQNAAFKTHEASEMLRMICYKHSRTLKSLNLEGFVRESSQVLTTNIVDVRPYYETLMNLQEMTVDYSQIFENVISSIFDYATSLGLDKRKGRLEKLKVICNGSKSVNYQGIPSAAWKYFRKTFPALRIDFLFHNGPFTRSSFDVFFVRYMPVRLLNIKWNQHRDERDDIGSLLKYIASCETTDLLEDLNIMWPHNSTNLARDLIIFLRICHRLQILQLHVEHPVDELDAVLKWWLENGPKSLELAQITIANVPTSEDIENYTNVANEYAPLLQVSGLNLILIVDSE